MKTNSIKVSQTRFPKLTQAILAHLDRDQLKDVARHGADAGFSGFTYTNETVRFYKEHQDDIVELAKMTADEMGTTMVEMVKGFRCLNGEFDLDEIAAAIFYDDRSMEPKDGVDTIQNALSWFALEEIARELNPEI